MKYLEVNLTLISSYYFNKPNSSSVEKSIKTKHGLEKILKVLSFLGHPKRPEVAKVSLASSCHVSNLGSILETHLTLSNTDWLCLPAHTALLSSSLGFCCFFENVYHVLHLAKLFWFLKSVVQWSAPLGSLSRWGSNFSLIPSTTITIITIS